MSRKLQRNLKRVRNERKWKKMKENERSKIWVIHDRSSRYKFNWKTITRNLYIDMNEVLSTKSELYWQDEEETRGIEICI